MRSAHDIALSSTVVNSRLQQYDPRGELPDATHWPVSGFNTPGLPRHPCFASCRPPLTESDFVALRKLPNVIGRAKRQRLNGKCWLASATRYKRTAIDDEEILYIMRAMIPVDHRRLRIITHATRAEQVHSAAGIILDW